MKNVLNGLKKDYDYVLIDCMPSLGMITINALACADKVIIPVQSQFLATKGMGHLLQTVIKVRKEINPNLEVGGILLSLVDERTRLARNIKQELNDTYGMVFQIFDLLVFHNFHCCIFCQLINLISILIFISICIKNTIIR